MTRSRAVGGLGALLSVVSAGHALKFLGPLGTAGFFGGVFVMLVIIARMAPAFVKRVTERQALILAAATLLALIALFVAVYPIANAGLTGRGSDREDNINYAVRAMLNGQNPYEHRGYYLPGTFLLALPFVALGNSAWQNFLWVAVLFFASRRLLGDGRLALLLLWTLLLLCPAFLQELVTGGDLITNTVSVIVAALLVTWNAGRSGQPPWKTILVAVFFGVALASRLNFALVAPLVIALVARRAGWKIAVLTAAATIATVVALGLAFGLADPDHLAMLRFQNRFGFFEAAWPGAKFAVPAAATAMAAFLAWPRLTRSTSDLLRNSTLVLAFPIVAGMVLAVMQFGPIGLGFAVQGWGLFFLFSGALWLWPEMFPAPET